MIQLVLYVNTVSIMLFIIHLRLNNVQQSMGKPGTQAQLIKTRILYSRSREKSVSVLLVTREIRIMYSKSCALQQIYVRDQGG